MLKVTLDGEVFEYNQTKLMASEAAMIQKYAGRTVKEWAEGIENGDIDCIIPLVWLIKKRQGHAVSYESFGKEEGEGGWDFDLGAFKIEDLDVEEKKAEDAEDDAAPDPTLPVLEEAVSEQ